MTGCRLIEESVVLTFSTYSWGKHFFGFVFLFILSFKRKDICGKICMLLYKRKTDQYCLKWGKCYCSFFSHFLLLVLQIRINWIVVFFKAVSINFLKTLIKVKQSTINVCFMVYMVFVRIHKYKCGFGSLYSFSDKVIHVRVCYFFLSKFFFSIIHYSPPPPPPRNNLKH